MRRMVVIKRCISGTSGRFFGWEIRIFRTQQRGTRTSLILEGPLLQSGDRTELRRIISNRNASP